jgi:hypothetical protein
MQLATNAPAHWPAVVVKAWDPVKTWNNAEAVAIALDQGFVAAGTPCPILLYGSRLGDAGVLEVPIQVTDGGRKYCVLLYDGIASEEAAAAFAGARAVLESDGSTRAVYYAPLPLGDAAPASPFGPFRMRYIARCGDSIPAGQYAMWWATPGDEDFRTSPTFHLVDAFYRACDGAETWILGDVLHSLGVTHGPLGRPVVLPAESEKLPITGPEERLLIFGASSKGLRFFFPVATTEPRYRDQFWKHVTGYAGEYRQKIEAAGALDNSTDQRGLPWWLGMCRMLEAQGTSATMQFGPLHVFPENRGEGGQS